jgi:putative lipoic acid-binding regulatory protein
MEDPGSQLRFPLDCDYRVVARADAGNVEGDVAEVIKAFDLGVRVTRGRRSENGAYQTWQFTCRLNDLETLRGVGAALAAINGVKIVL